jgi:HEAT repeat protein
VDALGSRPRWLLLLLTVVCLTPVGCGNMLDEMTSNEFWKRNWFQAPPPPLEVLSTDSDGDHRARALRALSEPKQHGGTDQEQEAIVTILTKAASGERQAYCRLAALESLSHFKDPRAVEAIKEAYYRAGNFNPEEATVVRCLALAALGETGNPTAVDLLVRVLREPPVEGPDQDKEQKLQERLAAARALGKFKHYQGVEALVAVLRTERQDMVALRSVAQQSLREATGHDDVPPDAAAWDDFIHRNGVQLVGAPPESDPPVVQPAGWNQRR